MARQTDRHTHGHPSCLKDGLDLGRIHHNLLQTLKLLLCQFLSVANELGYSCIHVVVRDNLDQLWEVVGVPLSEREG